MVKSSIGMGGYNTALVIAKPGRLTAWSHAAPGPGRRSIRTGTLPFRGKRR